MPKEKEEKKESTEKPREVKLPVKPVGAEPWKKKKLKDGTKVLVRPKKLTDGTPIVYGPDDERLLEMENSRRKAAGEPLIE